MTETTSLDHPPTNHYRHDPVTMHVNGHEQKVHADDRHLLTDTLREECGLPGTRAGCHEGVCGTCTVLVDDQPIRACLALSRRTIGEITTVEALEQDTHGPMIMHAFAARHALQCGYCTPGFELLTLAMVRAGQRLAPTEVEQILGSNLCRCTGYRPIINAALDVLRTCGLLHTEDNES